MSGYFARLAALAQAPAASAMPEQALAAPQPLERHIEIDASLATEPVSASVGTFRYFNLQQPSASHAVRSAPTEPHPTTHAMPAVAAITRDTRDSSPGPGSELPAAQPIPVPPITPMRLSDPATPAQVQPSAQAVFADVRPPALIRESTSPALAPTTDAQSATASPPLAPFDPVARSETFNLPDTTGLQTRSAPLPSAAANLDIAGHVNGQATGGAPILHDEMIWPDMPGVQSGSFIASSPAGAGKVGPRTEVRIGTITLEVRAAPLPPAVVPPPPAAAQAAMTPQQYSLRRHYLRWS